MKALTLLFVAFLGVTQLAQAQQAEEIVGLKFNDIKKMVSTAVVSKELSLGIKATVRDVTDYELSFVRVNEVEFSAIAPGFEKEDGIPNYCSIVLARPNDYSDYTVKSVDCSPLD
jgi:hypothetical protein